MSITKIILADDHRIVRQGLHALLRSDGRFEVVAEADDGPSAVRLAVELSPDVVVMDLRMPGMTGTEAAKQILADRPGTKIIVLSGHIDSLMATELLRAGVLGCVLKDAAVDELVSAITAALEDKVFVSPFLMTAVMTDLGRDGGERHMRPLLSPREQEVLQLVAGGRSTKQAARDLNVSVKTIETHRRNLMEKLQIDNVADLTKYAIRNGLCAL